MLSRRNLGALLGLAPAAAAVDLSGSGSNRIADINHGVPGTSINFLQERHDSLKASVDGIGSYVPAELMELHRMSVSNHYSGLRSVSPSMRFWLAERAVEEKRRQILLPEWIRDLADLKRKLGL